MQKRQVNETRIVFGVLAVISLLFGFSIFLFVHSGFLRNYGGDIIAVTFLYSVLKATLRPKPIIAAAIVLAVAIGIELLQTIISFPHGAFASLTLGSTFDPLDILTYLLTVFVLYSLDIGLRASSSASAS
jgi:uncharacterized membrane protein